MAKVALPTCTLNLNTTFALNLNSTSTLKPKPKPKPSLDSLFLDSYELDLGIVYITYMGIKIWIWNQNEFFCESCILSYIP